jgi:hypothetical protein
MLLGLNELRTSLDRRQPFARDLALVRAFAGNSSGLGRALDRLAPYAESGVLSRDALQEEFKGLAGDIVMAKLSGEDMSVKDRAMQRLSRFVKVRKTGTEGEGVDATVARAQKMLDEGDIRGAVATLQTLEGAPRETADPFIEKASGAVIAEESSGALSHLITESLASASAPGAFSLEGIVNSASDDFGGEAAPVYVSPALLGKNGP